MSWKKSKDGGLDFDVEASQKYERAKERMFNPYGTAHTMTFGLGNHPEVPAPETREERMERIRKRIRDNRLSRR